LSSSSLQHFDRITHSFINHFKPFQYQDTLCNTVTCFFIPNHNINMSAVEATKPVEEPVVAPTEAATEAPAVTETAPVETAAAEPVAAEEPAVATETPAEATEAAAVKEDVKPVEEGTLGYKGPGLLK
jgi:hypothetical protein